MELQVIILLHKSLGLHIIIPTLENQTVDQVSAGNMLLPNVTPHEYMLISCCVHACQLTPESSGVCAL